VVFLIDLPNDPKGMRAQQTSFGRELSRFLRALGLEDQLISGLDKYDFTETKNFTFVHSMYVHIISPLILVALTDINCNLLVIVAEHTLPTT